MFTLIYLSLALVKAHAEFVDVRLAQQFWTFELLSSPLFTGNVKLKPEKRNLSNKLKPLLTNKKY